MMKKVCFKQKTLLFYLLILLFFGCSVKEEANTFILRPNPSEGKDAIIAKAYANNNYGNHAILHLTSRLKSGIIEDDNRFVLSFDFEGVAEGAKIDSAFIYLYNSGKKNYGERSFLIQRIIYPWKENRITWVYKPEVDTTNQIVVNNSQEAFKDYKIGITPFAKSFINRKQRNLGFMFRLVNEDLENKTVNFYSSNCLFPNKRPKLEIYYRVIN